jgi:hypothetical protein
MTLLRFDFEDRPNRHRDRLFRQRLNRCHLSLHQGETPRLRARDARFALRAEPLQILFRVQLLQLYQPFQLSVCGNALAW